MNDATDPSAMIWLKLYVDARNDRKLSTLSDAEHRVWFNLLCMAGEWDRQGRIPAINRNLLALEVARGDHELLNNTLRKLSELNIAASDDEEVVFLHFVERQGVSRTVNAAKERMRRHRQRKKEEEQQVPPADGGEAENVTGRYTTLHHVTPRDALEQNRTEQNRILPPRVSSPAGGVTHAAHAAEKSEVMTKFQGTSGPVETAVFDRLTSLVDRYTAEWVLAALDETVANLGSRNLNYTEKILTRWAKDGFKSKRGRADGAKKAEEPYQMRVYERPEKETTE